MAKPGLRVAPCILVEPGSVVLCPSKFIRWKKLKQHFRWTSPGQMLKGVRPMKTDALTNPIVKAAIEALQNGNRKICPAHSTRTDGAIFRHTSCFSSRLGVRSTDWILGRQPNGNFMRSSERSSTFRENF